MFARLLDALAPRRRAVLGTWLLLLVVGAVTYTSLIPREGFPPVDVPIAVSAGHWLASMARSGWHSCRCRHFG